MTVQRSCATARNASVNAQSTGTNVPATNAAAQASGTCTANDSTMTKSALVNGDAPPRRLSDVPAMLQAIQAQLTALAILMPLAILAVALTLSSVANLALMARPAAIAAVTSKVASAVLSDTVTIFDHSIPTVLVQFVLALVLVSAIEAVRDRKQRTGDDHPTPERKPGS